ncbi:MAG: outer membrane beta-barrel protein [Rickettsiales bacterium]|nr:outer membrane beta-barrel protein [Rickettsiales bacterium]
MKKSILIACLTTALAALSNASYAYYPNKQYPNWFVSIHGEISYVDDADVKIGGANGGEISFETDTSWGIGVGYRPGYNGNFFDNTRFEFEYTYRNYNFDQLQTSTGFANLDGSLKGQAYMANMYYDIPTGGRFTPYIGGGMGMVLYDFDSSNFAVDDQDFNFAYQLMTGIYYSPASLPNSDWGVGYRLFGSSDPEFNNALNQKVELETLSHNIEFLARFRF